MDLAFFLGERYSDTGQLAGISGAVEFRTDVFEVSGQLIWGATARILSDLLERLEGIA